MGIPTKTKNEINAAIKAALPEMHSDILQERLKLADTLERENKKLTKELEAKEAKIEKLESRGNELSAANIKLQQENDGYKRREEDIKNREVEIRIKEEILHVKEAANEEKVSFMRDVLEVPFKNRILRETTYKKERNDLMHWDSNGNPVPQACETHIKYTDDKEES